MAIIWWWSYLLVMYLVLTNMFIAMVIDSFNRANAEQASKTSMVQQVCAAQGADSPIIFVGARSCVSRSAHC